MNIFLVVYFKNDLPDDAMTFMNRIIELRTRKPSRSTKIRKGIQSSHLQYAEIASGEQDGELDESLELKL